MTREQCLTKVFDMNDQASRLILQERYEEAAQLVARSSEWAPSEEGRNALIAKAAEIAVMGATDAVE